MGKNIIKTKNEAVERWHKKMPRFFRQIVVLCACVALSAFVINTALVISGAEAHLWWRDIYPLLIGVPTGMVIVCKLTVAGGYRDIDPDPLSHGRPDHLQRPESRRSRRVSDGHYNDSDVETALPPAEIEPYDEPLD